MTLLPEVRSVRVATGPPVLVVGVVIMVGVVVEVLTVAVVVLHSPAQP